jgi:hypothetical protein
VTHLTALDVSVGAVTYYRGIVENALQTNYKRLALSMRKRYAYWQPEILDLVLPEEGKHS